MTLRGQGREDGGTAKFRLRVENLVPDGPAKWQAVTQQALSRGGGE